MTKSSPDTVVFVPLGGVGEIGMNMALYGAGPQNDRTWMMVDCGITFPDATETGIDVIMPDIEFIRQEQRSLCSIVITHAHEDHIGALAYLWERLKAPVFMSTFAAGMLQAKFPEKANEIPITIINPGEHFNTGPFSVEFVQMSHSIPEPMALNIKTENRTIFHTADWKLDRTPGLGNAIDLKRIEEIGNDGVDAIVCDSTNALVPGFSPSESDVTKGLSEQIKLAKKRVVIATFSSQVARIKAIAEAAEETGRDVVVVGRALMRVITVARESGYLKNCKAFLDEDAFGYLPRDKVILLVTGSQGEPRAALSKIANGAHRNVALSPGDTVIFSSRTIPGNERSIYAIINKLIDQGLEIVTDREAMVHVSGHPRQSELEELYGLLKPKIAIPVHGEPWHLTIHGKLAKHWGIKEVIGARNGDMVTIDPGSAEIIDEVPVGRLHMDGNLIRQPELTGLKTRRNMAFNGHISVALALDEKGNLVDDPDIAVDGLPQLSQQESFEDIIYDAVVSAIESMPQKKRRDIEVVREAARRAARSSVVAIWGKKPVCRILISQV